MEYVLVSVKILQIARQNVQKPFAILNFAKEINNTEFLLSTDFCFRFEKNIYISFLTNMTSLSFFGINMRRWSAMYATDGFDGTNVAEEANNAGRTKRKVAKKPKRLAAVMARKY